MNIFSHDGIVTLLNPATGNHRTFRVKTQKEDAEFAPGEKIIYLLTGPNNESDYQSFGIVKSDYIILWKSKRTEVFEKYCKILRNPARYNLEVNFEGKCRRCQRTLSTPESVLSGYGPECIKKV